MINMIKIVHIKDFIHLSLQGDMDFLKLKKFINELSSIHGSFIDYDLLIDSRGAKINLGFFELWDIAKELASVIHAGDGKGFTAKIIVFCPAEHFNNAKFLETCSLNNGLNMRSFTSFDDIFEWMSNSLTHNLEKSLLSK